MSPDCDTGRRRLPGYDDWTADAERAREARASRDAGVRRVRTMSNWTAAALVAAVTLTSGYFAHMATAGTQVSGYSGATGQGQPGASGAGHKASLTHPVVTSGGSGVTAGGGGAAGAGRSGVGDN